MPAILMMMETESRTVLITAVDNADQADLDGIARVMPAMETMMETESRMVSITAR